MVADFLLNCVLRAVVVFAWLNKRSVNTLLISGLCNVCPRGSIDERIRCGAFCFRRRAWWELIPHGRRDETSHAALLLEGLSEPIRKPRFGRSPDRWFLHVFSPNGAIE